MASLFGPWLSGSFLNYSSITDKGLSRDNNEDSHLDMPEQGVWLVADGMGGHEAGEVASSIVRDTVQQSIRNGKNLADAIQQSHQAVLQAVREGVGAAGMGSTVVAVRSHQQEYEVAWVGDSRAYLWSGEENGGRLEQLTTDHSYVQMLLASGAISAEDVGHHPDRNVITQCVGSMDMAQVKVDTLRGKWQRHQWILLCSDGLTDEVDNQAIAQLLGAASAPKEAANRLMQAALDNGGRDNITIQIIESPLDYRQAALWEWLPVLTGLRRWDTALYGLALVCLLLIFYWILA